MLLAGLPPESLWYTALRQLPAGRVKTAGDVDAIRWGTTHDMLAALIDATNGVQWTLAQVNSKKNVPQPKPFPRPGSGKRQGAMSQRSRARIKGWLTNSRKGR